VRLNWRLTKVWQKVLYVALGWGVLALTLFVLRTWGFETGSWAYALVGFVGDLAYTFIGVRSFRGYLEPSMPPRLWWRWSGRPKAGFWLGAFYTVSALSSLEFFWPRDGRTVDYLLASLTTLSSIVVAVGYFNSSFRLRARPDLWSRRRITAGSAEIIA
jgi:hypothetical protein